MKSVVFLLTLAVVFFFMTNLTSAQELFKADFENTTGVNDAAAWNAGAQTPALVNWINVNHAGSGRLFQTLNSNANTTTTVAPAGADCNTWTDYTVQMTVTYEDDDTWQLVFRYTDPDNYYFFGVDQQDSDEGTNPPAANLRKAPAADGGLNGDEVVPNVDIPGVVIDQGAKTGDDLAAPVGTEEWVLRVVVAGDNIKCYFFARADITNLDDPAPNAAVIETTDASNPQGCVGIRNDTMVGTIDDFVVFGPAGLAGPGTAVQPQGKLATVWGRLKEAAY